MFKKRLPRIYLSGHYYFVTIKTRFNQPIFREKRFTQAFFKSLDLLKQRGDFLLVAGVLLPDHLHLLLRPEKKNISEIMHDLKSYTANRINGYWQYGDCRRGRDASPQLVGDCEIVDNNSNNKKLRPGLCARPFKKIWQRSFYCHIINSDRDLANHYNYICYNPVKHGYVAESAVWPDLWFDYI